LFYPIVYKNGFRVFNENEAIPSPTSDKIGKTIVTDGGKFKIISNELCLFRINFPFFTFRIHTPFPIKGTISWKNGIASVEGRIPVFSSVFFLAWLTGCTAAGTLGMESEGLSGITFLLLGWVFASAIYLFSVPLEIRRAREIINEIASCLTSRSS